MVFEGFDRQSRHNNRLVSPHKKQRKDISFLTVDLADKYGIIEEKYNAIIQISANIDSYFPINEINSQAQNNIRAIISHATHAYAMLNDEHINRQDSETKLRKSRFARNPKTNERVFINKKYSIIFKSSKMWKKKVNEKI